MRNTKLFIVISLLLMLFQTSLLSQIGGGGQPPAPTYQPAFPGAEGWGKNATGWRVEGTTQVIHVTNLNNAGSGSLREAIETSGERIIVFDISGTINLVSNLRIQKPFCYIAGQSAPGDGITLRFADTLKKGGDLIQVQTHDVVIRYLKFRPGPGYSHIIQTEDADTLIDYKRENRDSTDIVVKVDCGCDSADAIFVINSSLIPNNFYDLSTSHTMNIRYFSENDGACSLMVIIIQNTRVDTFGTCINDSPYDNYYMVHLIDFDDGIGPDPEIFLEDGDTIIIRGYIFGGARARIDYIEILAAEIFGSTNGVCMWAKDSASVDYIYKVIIDHCSFSWANNRNICLYNKETAGNTGMHDITVQWCIFSECLRWSTHSEGEHSLNFLVGDSCTNISIHHNLFAHSSGRNPFFKSGLVCDIVNNVIYNWAIHATHVSSEKNNDASSYANIIKNYYKAGLNSPSFIGDHLYGFYIYESTPILSKFYLEGNIGPHRPDSSYNDWAIVKAQNGNPFSYKIDIPIPTSPYNITTYNAVNARDSVLKNAGAIIPRRDNIDKRIVQDVINTTGSIINHPSEVGGWIDFPPAQCSTDTDNDGMPDWWENKYSYLNCSIADANLDGNNSGYLNIEEYLNSLVSIIDTIYEAEDMSLGGGYIVEDRGYASNGKLIRIDNDISTTGEASFVIDNITGSYSITVCYIDEDDGESEFELLKNITSIGTWIADDVNDSFAILTKTFYITLSIGDTIMIVGTSNLGEHARIDYVKLVESDGQAHGESVINTVSPLVFTLNQNYPNPFQKETIINYSISGNASIEIDVYNILGQRVKTLVNAEQSGGRYSVIWDGSNNQGKEVSSGVYFYRLQVNTNSIIKKMLFVQ